MYGSLLTFIVSDETTATEETIHTWSLVQNR